MNAASEARETIRLIRRSLIVFGLGVASLLPVFALLCAPAALGLWAATRRRRAVWNPTQRYLDWGMRLALAGMLFTAIAVGLLFWANLQAGATSHGVCDWCCGRD